MATTDPLLTDALAHAALCKEDGSEPYLVAIVDELERLRDDYIDVLDTLCRDRQAMLDLSGRLTRARAQRECKR